MTVLRCLFRKTDTAMIEIIHRYNALENKDDVER